MPNKQTYQELIAKSIPSINPLLDEAGIPRGALKAADVLKAFSRDVLMSETVRMIRSTKLDVKPGVILFSFDEVRNSWRNKADVRAFTEWAGCPAAITGAIGISIPIPLRSTDHAEFGVRGQKIVAFRSMAAEMTAWTKMIIDSGLTPATERRFSDAKLSAGYRKDEGVASVRINFLENEIGAIYVAIASGNPASNNLEMAKIAAETIAAWFNELSEIDTEIIL